MGFLADFGRSNAYQVGQGLLGQVQQYGQNQVAAAQQNLQNASTMVELKPKLDEMKRKQQPFNLRLSPILTQSGLEEGTPEYKQVYDILAQYSQADAQGNTTVGGYDMAKQALSLHKDAMSMVSEMRLKGLEDQYIKVFKKHNELTMAGDVEGAKKVEPTLNALKEKIIIGRGKFAEWSLAMAKQGGDEQWESDTVDVGGKPVRIRRNKVTGKEEQVSAGPVGGTTVNVGTGKVDFEASKELIGQLPKLQGEADSANSGLVRIDKMIGLLDRGAGGVVGRGKATAAPYLEALGVRTQGLTDAQTYETLAKTLGGSMRVDVIGPGPVSEYEQDLLQKVNAGGSASTGAARELLNYYRGMAIRKIQRYNRAVEGIKGQSGVAGKLYPTIDIKLSDPDGIR